MENTDLKKGLPISIHYHPANFSKKKHCNVKKDRDGIKRRFLYGIASGIQEDGDGERLTQNCIESLNQQCREKDVLLMADLHHKGGTEAIGIITNHKVLDNGDWWIEARLFDETDQGAVKADSIEAANTLWNQINGFPPFSKPAQKGFSIEGRLTDLLSHDGNFKRRVVNDMEIDFVAVVPRPSYKDSVAHSIAKALSAKSDWSIRKSIADRFEEIQKEQKDKGTFYKAKIDLDNILEDSLVDIMQSDSIDKLREINTAIDTFREALIKLLADYEPTFQSQETGEDEPTDSQAEPKLNLSEVKEKLKNLSSRVSSLK